MIATSPSVQHGYVRYAHDGIIQYHIVQCHSAADGYSLGYGLRLIHEANYRSIAMPIGVATQRALRKHVSTDRHKRRKGDILDFHFFSRASSRGLRLALKPSRARNKDEIGGRQYDTDRPPNGSCVELPCEPLGVAGGADRAVEVEGFLDCRSLPIDRRIG